MRRRSPPTCRRRRSRPTAASWHRWWRPTLFGQNTSAIAATEAQYGEMWAQDALAMDTYAASSAAASKLTPFTPAPQTTNSGGLASQAAAVGPGRFHLGRYQRADAYLHGQSDTAMAGEPLHRLHGYPQRPAEQPVWANWGINVHGALQRGQSPTWLHHRVQRHRAAHQLPGIAVPQVHACCRVWRAPERGSGRRTYRTLVGARLADQFGVGGYGQCRHVGR